MAVDFEKSIPSLSALYLWYKVSGNESLYLSDVPEIIRLRWPYFRDNWDFLKKSYEDKIPGYINPELLRAQIKTFNRFVISQRNSKIANNPFDSDNVIYRFYSIFDVTPINSISLTYEEQQILEDKKNKILNYNRGDFLNIRSQLQKERDDIADKVGTTDETYNITFHRSSQVARVAVKNKDINKMLELQDAIKAVDFILANSFSLESSIIDPFALAKINANNPDINIQTYFSGYLTKINYGEDLQSLALRTLGDPNKWIDIAITNGLKPPYIDEIGEKIPLISNGSANQINIAESNNNQFNADKLFIGQVVLLQSSTQNFPEQRNIQNIVQIPISGEIVIELSGASDLQRYAIEDGAYIRIYKPNTVNSSFFVMIPSEDTIDDNIKSDIPWFLQGSTATDKRQKVDISIDDKGDLNFNSTGDLLLSYGITNSVQAIKLKMLVENGELRRHPGYGLVSVQGNKLDDVARIKGIISESINSMISSDERFSNLEKLDIRYVPARDTEKPNIINVSLVVKLAGSGQLLPITFTINKG